MLHTRTPLLSWLVLLSSLVPLALLALMALPLPPRPSPLTLSPPPPLRFTSLAT